uniref:WSN domain-containing protein n=1 Tax=Caenorhabditis tropicalis TaxID=1561998 RepID=A0A1I7UP97_9PELO
MFLALLLFLNATGIDSYSKSQRVHRSSGNDFSETVSNFKAIASISSAIHMEIGLIDGSIQAYSIIPDLLRMGSVKPKSIALLDSKAIEAALQNLEQLSTKKPDEAVQIEKRILALEEMRIKGSKDLSIIPGLKEYEEVLKGVQGLEDLKNTLADIKKTVNTLNTNLKDLKGTNPADIDSASGFMITITTFLTKLESAANSFDATLSRLANAKKIQEASEFLNDLIKEDSLRSAMNSLPAFTDQNVADLQKNINNLLEISKSVEASRLSFMTIRDLVTSRKPSFHHPFQYIPGLPSGQSDLVSLNGFLRTPWVIERIPNHDLVTPNLEKAFLLSISLATELKSVENLWSSLEDKNTRKSVDEVVNTCLQLGDISGLAAEIPGLVNELKTCDTSVKYPKSFEKELKDVQNVMEKLNQEVSAISGFGYMDQFKDLSALKVHFDTKKLSDDEAKNLALKTIGILKSDEGILKLEQNMKNLTADVDSLLSFITNNNSLGEVKTQLDTLSTYQKDVNTPEYTGLFTCLAGIKAQGQPVKQTIEALQKTFSIDSNAKSTIDSIIKSGPKLGQVKTEAEKFKNIKNHEATALKKAFPKSEEVSQKLGLGVQGLDAIAKAVKAKGKLNDLVEGLKNAGSLSAPQQKAVQEIQQLPEVFKSIDEFISSLDGRDKRSTADFNSLQPILEKASKVKGVDIDMMILREAAESLKLPFDDDLEALDLNFARFKIADAMPSLLVMDKFFVEYAKTISEPDDSDDWDAAPKKLGAIEYACIVIGAFVILFIIAILLYCCWWKKRSDKVIDLETGETDSEESKGKKEDLKNSKGKKDDPKDPKEKKDPDGNNGNSDDPKKKKSDGKKDGVDGNGGNNDEKHAGDDKTNSNDETKGTNKGGKKEGNKEEENDQEREAYRLELRAKIKEEEDQLERIIKEKKELEEKKPKPDNYKAPFLGTILKLEVQRFKEKMIVGDSPLGVLREDLALLGGFNTRNLTEAEHTNEKDREECRYQTVFCKRMYMIPIEGFKNDKFIHGNFLDMPNGSVASMTQGPLRGGETEVVDGVTITKKDTCPKQHAAIFRNKPVVSFQLCNEIEKGEEKCAFYYPQKEGETRRYGIYLVECLKVFTKIPGLSGDDFTLYKLKITNTETKQTMNHDILKYIGWPDTLVPNTPDVCLEMYNFWVEQYKKGDFFVHCSAGVGRTGTLVGIFYGLEKSLYDHVKTSGILTMLRDRRCYAVQKPVQALYIQQCLTKGIMERRNVQELEEYEIVSWLLRHLDVLLANSPEKNAEEDKKRIAKTNIKALYKEMMEYIDEWNKKHPMEVESNLTTTEEKVCWFARRTEVNFNNLKLDVVFYSEHFFC